MRNLLFTLFLLVLALPLSAQALKRVHGEYIYRAPDNVTLEQAKLTALQRAKTQALADAFGQVVTQSNATRVENSGEASDVNMISLGGSEVKGEWIETIGEPRFDISYEQGMLIVKCSVKGRAREIVSDRPAFEAHLLRNGTSLKFESDVFHSGDDLYLRFLSPVDGYVNVYLDDGQGRVFAMLPYRSQGFGATEVKGNRNYLFFSAANGDIEADEYTMTCSGTMELNQLIVVFSENSFTKVATTDGATDTKSFLAWLAKLKAHDVKACSQTLPIEVRP